MKRNILIAALLMVVPFNLMAQDDDMYFVPKKKSKTEVNESQRQSYYDFSAEDPDMVQEECPDYHTGALRDADEYNRRRGHQGRKFGEVYMSNDTLYITEEDMLKQDSVEMRMRQLEEEEDYGYSGRLVRFHGGVRSPYYWDYYYDWAYDPFFYDPYYYNSWYYGPGYYGWYGPYYSSWYRHGWYGWYDPWYDYAWGWGGYYGGYWGGYYGGRGHHSEAYRTGGRRVGSSASYGRSMAGVSADRAGRRGGVTASHSGSANSIRTGGINSAMRRDGLNAGISSSRGTRGNTVNVGTRSQSVSSQRSNQPVRTTTPTISSSSRSSSPSFGGGGASMGGGRSGGSFGGGASRGSSRGGR